MKNKSLLTIISFLNISFFVLSFTSTVEPTNKANSTEVLLTKILVEITKLNENAANQICNETETLSLLNELTNVSSTNKTENRLDETFEFVNVKETIATKKEEVVSIIEVKEEAIVLENKAMISSTKFTNVSYNSALVDKIDDIYFESVNESRSISEERKDELTAPIIEMEKDLEEFSAFSDFVHPEAILEQEKQEKIADATEFVNNEHELTTSSYYNTKDIKSHLKAEDIAIEFTGYAVNLMVSNEKLTPENSIFHAFGGLKVEKTLNGQYRYFLDNFQTKKGTKDYLEKIISSRFPEAEVVFYKKGQRKNKTWQFFFAN